MHGLIDRIKMMGDYLRTCTDIVPKEKKELTLFLDGITLEIKQQMRRLSIPATAAVPPEGYKLVGYGHVKRGEYYVDRHGRIVEAKHTLYDMNRWCYARLVPPYEQMR